MDPASAQQDFHHARAHFIDAVAPPTGRARALRLVVPDAPPEPGAPSDHLDLDGLYAFELTRRGKSPIRGFAAADGRVVLGGLVGELPILLRACALLTEAPRVSAFGLAERLVWLEPEQGTILAGTPDPFAPEPAEDLAPRFEPSPDGGVVLTYTTALTGRTGSTRRVPHALRIGPGYVLR